MKWPIALLVATSLLAGCGTPAMAPSGANAPLYRQTSSNVIPASKQTVYWTMSEGTYDPQVQFARVPLRDYSNVTNVYSGKKKLYVANGMALDNKDRL